MPRALDSGDQDAFDPLTEISARNGSRVKFQKRRQSGAQFLRHDAGTIKGAGCAPGSIADNRPYPIVCSRDRKEILARLSDCLVRRPPDRCTNCLACDAIGPLFDRLSRHTIRAGCVAAPVTGQPVPGMGQRSAIAYKIEQIREPLFRGRDTPPIQLALHVENKLGIHRVGQDVHLLPASCIHCPPSPCGRLSRPRTTTQAPSPLRAFAGRFGHPSPRGRKRGRVPKFHRCSSSAVGADSTPYGFRLPGLTGLPGG